MYTIIGHIQSISELQSTGKGLEKKTVLIVEDKEERPKSAKVDFLGKDVHQLDPYKEKDKVEIHFSLRYSETSNGNVYNNVKGINIQRTL